MLNAFILYNKNTPGKKMQFLKFKLDYIGSILIPLRNENICSHLLVPTKSIHFLELIPPTPKKVNPRGRCVVCYEKKTKKEVRYRCKSCHNMPALFPAPYFEIDHTRK